MKNTILNNNLDYSLDGELPTILVENIHNILMFDVLIIGIKTDRETLYSKIDARIEQMVKDGLVEEVRGLVSRHGKNIEALNTIGYKEIVDYFDKKLTLKEAIEKIKTNTHAYVRRQETWFKRDKNIKWVSNVEEAEKEINKFLKK